MSSPFVHLVIPDDRRGDGADFLLGVEGPILVVDLITMVPDSSLAFCRKVEAARRQTDEGIKFHRPRRNGPGAKGNDSMVRIGASSV